MRWQIHLLWNIRQALKSNFNIDKLPDIIPLVFNIDGLPLFKSSLWQFWPILYKALGEVFNVALFYGKKPEPVQEFLHDFLREMENFLKMESSIKISKLVFNCHVLYAMHQHDLFSKALLVIPVIIVASVVLSKVFDLIIAQHSWNWMKSWDQILSEFSNLCYEGTHQTSRSPLIDLNVKCVSQFPLDYMHLCCLSVVRRLLSFLRSSPRK